MCLTGVNSVEGLFFSVAFVAFTVEPPKGQTDKKQKQRKGNESGSETKKHKNRVMRKQEDRNFSLASLLIISA